MNILITAATEVEIREIKEKTKLLQNHSIRFCATGIGCTLTAYMLAKKLQSAKFDLILNVGIAGSFGKDTPIGAVVVVETEVFGNLGITYPHKFSTLFDENFLSKNEYPFTNGKLHCKYLNSFNLKNFKPACGLTADAASGEKNQIEKRKTLFNADIETMEGAAFFYVCLSENVPFLEIRAVSNHVEPRNKSKWNIPLALDNLSQAIFDFLNNLQLQQIKNN
ncbi:MAG: futalosine hydrolase [Prevotellaceae bacterium]|jgi:futalosine hydrolase|nr:futalosine hydrolase [Prevotellaceae bacterium]